MKVGKKTKAHKKACKDYLQWFYDTHGYLYCENCDRIDLAPFSTHHIVTASRAPGHPELHNRLNMMCTCKVCHPKFHSAEFKHITERLIKERGLDKLFGGRK